MKIVIANDLGTDVTHNQPEDFADSGFQMPPAGVFVMGREYDVPPKVGEYFIRAGWGAEPGNEVVKPDPTRPVFVDPDNLTLGAQDRHG